MTRLLIRAAAALALVAGFAGPAAAHALDAEAKLKNGVVRVEAFFDDDTPAERASVTVTDAGGKVIAEGKTDERGVWSFPAPPPGKYKMVVDAGAGHRKVKDLTIPEQAKKTTDAPPAGSPPQTTSKTGGEPVVADGPVRPAVNNPEPGPTAPPPPAGDADDGPEIVVTDGPGRSEVTGPMRLVWAAAGLLAVGLGTWLLTRLWRAARGRADTADSF